MGLAASRCLSERAIDHVVLERGEVANSWRRERWDSLRLLTPNWQSRLPGHHYDGADPDGYMTMREVIDFISRFAVVSKAPVRTHTTVTRVQRTDAGYEVATTNGNLRCRTVMIASGACNRPSVPAVGQAVPSSIPCFTPFSYRNPDDLPEGGVLVVGASATGVQLADEIIRSGRPVTISVGEHVRLPRTYRGRDVLWWMEASGVWNQRYTEIDDLLRVRRLPSPQLIGTPERATLDLNSLAVRRCHDRRPPLRDPGRAGIVLRWPAKSVCAGRLEDEPLARHVRRVGLQPRPRGRGRSPGTVCTDPGAGIVHAQTRSEEWRNPFDPVGDGIST